MCQGWLSTYYWLPNQNRSCSCHNTKLNRALRPVRLSIKTRNNVPLMMKCVQSSYFQLEIINYVTCYITPFTSCDCLPVDILILNVGNGIEVSFWIQRRSVSAVVFQKCRPFKRNWKYPKDLMINWEVYSATSPVTSLQLTFYHLQLSVEGMS